MMADEQGLLETERYDYIVVGAGIEGSATAYYLAKKGHRTLLIEQFRLPHTRGSSHGASRLTRKAYSEPEYVHMMKEAFCLWSELEQETGEQLYVKLGLLVTSHKSTGEISRYAQSMKKHDLPFTLYSASEIRNRYPQLRYSNDWEGLFDPEGGILRAEKCLAAFQKQFRHYSGTIKDGERVNSVSQQRNEAGVTVTTSKGTYGAKNVVLCLGSWAPTFLKTLGLDLPLKPQVVKPCYWRETKPGAYTAGGSFPCILSSTEDHVEVYGLPCDEYPGLFKFCAHKGLDISHPDNRDAINADSLVRIPKKYIERYMSHLDVRPSIVETCVYTVTPDENFILDRLPRSNIVIGAGFSGHGFKFGPIVGKILGSMASGEMVDYDLAMFKLSRFDKSSKNKNKSKM